MSNALLRWSAPNFNATKVSCRCVPSKNPFFPQWYSQSAWVRPNMSFYWRNILKSSVLCFSENQNNSFYFYFWSVLGWHRVSKSQKLTSAKYCRYLQQAEPLEVSSSGALIVLVAAIQLKHTSEDNVSLTSRTVAHLQIFSIQGALYIQQTMLVFILQS